MLERHTNRHRGFGFVTFEDRRAVESAIKEMHGQDLDGREISVNKAEPKMHTDDTRYDSGGGRGDYRDSSGGRGDGPPPGNCFECGRSGHWARDCPNAGGGRSGRFSSKFSGGGISGRGDRFSGPDRFGDRYDGGRYGYRDPVDSRDRYAAGGCDRYASDRYPSTGDHFGVDRYGAPDRYAPSGYGRERERSYERDGVRGGGGYDRSGPRGGASYDRDGPRGGMGNRYDRDGPRGIADRYGGGGPARYDGGSYRERPGPYDRPSRGGGRFDDHY
jgi:heterogeneous nuclear ribonucleoprotein G